MFPSWQGNLTAADYQTMAGNGVKAVTIKATEGTYYNESLPVTTGSICTTGRPECQLLPFCPLHLNRSGSK